MAGHQVPVRPTPSAERLPSTPPRDGGGGPDLTRCARLGVKPPVAAGHRSPEPDSSPRRRGAEEPCPSTSCPGTAVAAACPTAAPRPRGPRGGRAAPPPPPP